MHPNTFLRSLWRSEILDQVFVAMSFNPRFAARYTEIIKPAIESEPIEGHKLMAYRVDNSRTGDSILTDIADGIAHSRIILADVSVIDEGRYTDAPIRNSNVMYEVRVALASRQPSEVLLIRDDDKKFLFDVSTIPHRSVDFDEKETAITAIRTAIADRLRETQLIYDARIRIAAKTLTSNELDVLNALSELGPDQARDLSMPQMPGMLSHPVEQGLTGLLQKGSVHSVAKPTQSDAIYYSLTPFGRGLAKAVNVHLLRVNLEQNAGNIDSK